MAQLDLASIVDTPHTLKDEDGRLYDVPTATMLSTMQIAQMRRLQHALPDAMAALDTNDGDPVAAAVTLNQLVDEYIQLIVPKMPPERIATLAIGRKVQIINWWQATETPKDAPRPNSTAGQRSRRGTRSPASSGSTGSTPSAS